MTVRQTQKLSSRHRHTADGDEAIIHQCSNARMLSPPEDAETVVATTTGKSEQRRIGYEIAILG
jgi:hypothetical protein